MALPLLRRIATPLLLPPSGPRLGPVHGISPAAAARRLLNTASKGEAKATQSEPLRLSNPGYRGAKTMEELNEAVWKSMDEYSEAVDTFDKVARASVLVIAAIPPIIAMVIKCE